EHPEVLLRASRRYKFFLVDEFQDTNSLQKQLLHRLALGQRKDANLFIVGDRKQSIYGFRGADVDVFREMTEALIKAGGRSQPLQANFRSQPSLIAFFNLLFARLFQPDSEINPQDLGQLGYVEHEPSVAERETVHAGPLAELMIDTLEGEDDPKARLTTRERDAQQLARRIHSLINPKDGSTAFQYGDIALLFRAMTDVPFYESVFRRAGIPYQTVLGKGFYEREEITDLIQLLRFLDNRTDELALAAVLRSPLCGISDDALLALRLGPQAGETGPGETPVARRHPRKLFHALRHQSEIDFIEAAERESLDGALVFLQSLIEKRNRYPVGDLLRFAVDRSEYTTVVAANFDGAQRLANIQKLFTLAERFENSGAHLIRDFVKYVHDFEAIGSRESEGQLDDSANAVTLMTIHQAKGLEFPVVILPDLQRISGPRDNWFLLDRHLGLTLKVPNGRGDQVAGSTFQTFSDRARQREQFESQRLLYVAATRAQDRLILSAAADELSKLERGRECWLKWIWQALELQNKRTTGLIDFGGGAQLQFTHNLLNEPMPEIAASVRAAPTGESNVDLSRPSWSAFPLLRRVEPNHDSAVQRFSVTQLINYQRCPRQYYFDRVLHLPSSEQMEIWNNAEAPEPPANLTATLKGAVIHRFCETYAPGDDAENLLRASFDHVVRMRQAELADRLIEINSEAAIEELLPLANNYLASPLFQRVERARDLAATTSSGGARFSSSPQTEAGLWSELSFRLRRPRGILSGAIDKLLITPSTNGGFDIEIIDFKTNRFRPGSKAPTSATATRRSRPHSAEAETNLRV
ncbi:MAG TPA: 3'-5' exonuclease, partial [Pyrinomonadaceae bacterium]|nr:3'-5' exonuclease [Pyrinomonadaceae bacterium]